MTEKKPAETIPPAPEAPEEKPPEAPNQLLAALRKAKHSQFKPEEPEPEPEELVPGLAAHDRGSFAASNANRREPNIGVIEAVKRCGSQRELAKLLNVEQSSVMRWIWQNCPAERAVQIEKAVGVSRRIIRPDLFGDRPLVITAFKPRNAVERERYGDRAIQPGEEIRGDDD